jgi:PBSX family phage portal protein
MMPDFPMEEVADTILRRSIAKEDMENLLKVTLVGRESGGLEEADASDGDGGSDRKSQSRQITEDPFNQMAAGEFIPPRFNPNTWAQALEQNTRLARCIRSFARNTVGLGWHIEPMHPITKQTPETDKSIVVEQGEKLRALFSYPNEKMPLSEIFYLMKVDEEATGNGYIEIVRNNRGDINRLYHVPATTMRVRSMKKVEGRTQVYGFVQIRGNQKRYFKEFGDKRVMDAISGDWYSGNSSLPPDQRASEILHFKVYDPLSSFYGSPRYVPASAAISGNRMAAIRNVSFFENDAVPRMALLVSGGRLTQESQQQIEDFVRGKARGPDQAHRVMIIQVEPTKVGFQQQNKTMVELRPLTVGVTEDASFQTYRSANDEEVREIFGLAPVFFSTENVNKASAAVSREITNEQEFEPDRLEKEYQINQTIVMDLLCSMMGNDPKTPDDADEMQALRKKIRVQFRFSRMTLTDPLDQARMDHIYAALGAITPNELRERLNRPPYPNDYFFGDKPLAVALAELSAGLALAITLKDEQKPPSPAAPGAPPPGAEVSPGVADVQPDAGGQAQAGKPDDLLWGIEIPQADVKTPTPGRTMTQQEPQKKPAIIPKLMTGVPPEKSLQMLIELMSDAREMSRRGLDLSLSGGNNGSH